MTVTTIASLAAGINRSLGNQNTKAADSLRTIVAASQASANPSDISSVSAATGLQNQIATLRIASQNIAQASSALQAADAGASHISSVLGRLQDLATRASSGDITTEERNQLNTQFLALRQEINRIATTTRFNGETLLNGSSEQLQVGGDAQAQQAFAIGGLTDADLFGTGTVDLSSAASAEAANAAVTEATTYVASQRSSISGLQTELDYATATVGSALQNQDAATATLSDADFIETPDSSAQAKLQQQATNTLFAQTNRLPANILQLLAE